MKFRALSACLFAIAFGCSHISPVDVPYTNPDIDPGPATLSLLKSEVPRDTSPQVDVTVRQSFNQNNVAFAFDLFTRLNRQESGNFVCSPYSALAALSLTSLGAAGQTENAMFTGLHNTLAADQFHPAMNELSLHLESLGKNAAGRDGAGFSLNTVNSLWGQRDLAFKQAFLDDAARYYGAGMNLVDFKYHPDESRILINDWVAAQTNDNIRDLLSILDSLTRLVLVNAVYFDAQWADTFIAKLTKDSVFHVSDSCTVTVPFMHKNFHAAYAKRSGYAAVSLPYDGREIDMLLVLPDPGAFEAVASSFAGGEYAACIAALASTYVELALPKFSFASGTFSMKDPLRAMGMSLAFSMSADFSKITAAANLYIDDVLQKVFIAVDEKGTTAAAATAVIMFPTSVPPPPTPFIADRPFFFFIRDIASNTVLFAGRVTDPAQN